jgi:hypothetical protein
MTRLGTIPTALSLLTLALALPEAPPAQAGPISFTGYVAKDFDPTDPNVRVTTVTTKADNIGEAKFIMDNGWVSGWSVKDVRTSYDFRTDTLYVGINTFTNAKGAPAIVGDADGNGDPGGASQQMAMAGGVDDPHLGGHKSVAVAFAADGSHGPVSPGTPLLIAGVPADKSMAAQGTLDNFTVAHYRNVPLGLGDNFGTLITTNPGTLAFDPSSTHPGLEFTINHFSKNTGIDPSKGFWVEAYAGSPDDVVAGETALQLTRIGAFAPQGIPEPSTVLSWSLVAAAGLFRLAVRRRRSDRA